MALLDSPDAVHLHNSICSNSLHLVPSDPTHLQLWHGSHTWIDLFIVKSTDRVLTYRKSDAPFIAGHDFIEISLACLEPPPITKSVMLRDLKKVNPELLGSILPLHLPPLDTHSLASPHSFITTTNSTELVLGPCPANPDIAERALTHALMCATDSVTPLRKAVLYSRRKPWVNPQIRALMKSRDRAYRLARSSGSAADLARFRSDFIKPFVLQTDASNHGLGAMLTQPHDDKERMIAYASRSLSSAKRNYSATEKECLAVKWGIWKMRDYLEDYHFTVLTDHQSLKWLEKIDSPSGRLDRWAIELGQWDYEIRYHRGAENHVADALSRQPLSVCTVDTKDSGKWYRDTLAGVQSDPRSFPEYCIHEGRLFRHLLHKFDFNEHSESEVWKLCVPAGERQRVLEKTHDNPTAGHLGIAKTLNRLARHYYWPGMMREEASHVRNCTQKHKTSQQSPPGTMHATTVTQPWEMVSVDLMGPKPRSDRGNTWLLVMQDRYTKWFELRALSKATSAAVSKALKEQVIRRQRQRPPVHR